MILWREESAKVLRTMQAGALTCGLSTLRGVGNPIEVVAKAIHDLERERATGLEPGDTFDPGT